MRAVVITPPAADAVVDKYLETLAASAVDVAELCALFWRPVGVRLDVMRGNTAFRMVVVSAWSILTGLLTVDADEPDRQAGDCPGHHSPTLEHRPRVP